jgi:two-component sensor histidine kinase
MLAIDNLEGLALTSLNLSGVYLELGDPVKAEQFIEESIALYTRLNNNSGLLDAYSMMYSILLRKGARSGAEALGIKSLEMAIEGEFLQSQIHWLDLLQKLYSAEGKHGKAYDLLSRRVRLVDSLSQRESDQRIAELETRYQTALKEQEITQLELEKQRAELALQEEGQRRVILVVSLVFSLILGAFLVYQVRFRIQVNRVLRNKNRQVSRSLADRETLLREIHHRVKNNLQVVSSLLRIQSRFVRDPMALEAIEQSRSRVKSMAMIHQRLYSKEDFEGVDVQTYISDLVQELSDSFDAAGKVSFQLDIQQLNLDLDTMTSLSLILNETITNSLKYAFPGERAGNISVIIKRKADDLWMTVEDDGVGFDPSSQKRSFGSTLIRSFSEKLNGSYNQESKGGVKHTLKIPDYFA